jgi:Flp pilus assembly protein CpaB
VALVAIGAVLAWRSVAFGAGSAPAHGSRVVVVTSAPVAAGALIPAESLTRRAAPVEVTPPDAVARLDEVAGRRAATDLAAGEVVRSARMSPPGATEIAARLEPDRRAVPVALAVPVPGLAEGQRLDLLSASAPGSAGSTGRPATVVAADAEVIAIGEDDTVVVVAVTSDDAPTLADALSVGPVVPALRPAAEAPATRGQRS